MDIAAVFLTLSFVFFCVYLYGLRPAQRWKIRRFPGPKWEWLTGSGKEFLTMGQPRAYQKWSMQHGPGPVGANIYSDTVVLLPNPETARKLLLHGSIRPPVERNSVLPKALRQENETSILWSRGEKWKGLRAIWQPVFYTGSLEGYVGIMDKCAKLLAEQVHQAAVADRMINIMPVIQDMTLNVVGQAAFGVDLHTQQADTAQLSEEERARSTRMRTAAKRIFLPPVMSLWVMLANICPALLPFIRLFANRFPDKPLKVLLDSRTAVFTAVESLIRDHRASLESPSHAVDIRSSLDGTGAAGSVDRDIGNIRKGVKPGSFIDLLVKGNDRETGKALPDSVIAQQAATMLLAGFETTASMLTFAAYLLSKPCNAEKQEKVIAEVDALGRDCVLSFADLEEKLPYMDAVLKESLRLFPPAHTLVREAEDDMVIDGYRVQKGQWLLVPAFSIHNDPKVWGPDAASFVPERWLDTDPVAQKRAKNNFFAFGGGPRICPGSRFALAEAKTALVRLLQRCRLELAPRHEEPLQLQATITMTAKNGVIVRPVLRK